MSRFSLLARTALVLAIGVAAGTACADDARKGIDAGNAAIRAAVLAGDVQKVTAVYTPNAEIIAPGAPIAAGTAAIAEFWKGFIATGPKDLALETHGVASSGDLAVEDGAVKITGNDGAVSTSRYVVAWKKDGGVWKIYRDTWNSEK